METIFHKQDYKYKNQQKSMYDVNEEVAQKLITKLSSEKPIRVMTKDNGRIIVGFLTKEIYKQFSLEVETQNHYGDSWIQYGEEMTFLVDAESISSELVIAEFWTNDKFEHEESTYIDGLVKFHFDVKEDIGVYRHPFDVYSPSELL